MEIYETHCCGLRELHHINEGSNEDIVERAYECIFEYMEDFAFFVFTDEVSEGNGTSLAKFIVENNLGRITKSRSRVNPNTGHTIKIWVWEIKHDNLKKWRKKNNKNQDNTC